jgi:uncharacterized protein YdhG (YjbR/CyaY superfamily)
MKPAKPTKSTAVAKDMDEYLAGVPQPARGTLNRVRAAVRAAAPEASEYISYRIPTFRYKGRPLLAFAAFSKHCSLFPMSMSVIKAFEKELKAFYTSKGTIRFPVDKPLPAALVKNIVKARLAQNEARQKR